MELYPEATALVDAELATATSAEDGLASSVQRLLHLLRVHAAMDVAWTSEFVGAKQVFRFVDVAPGKTGPEPGTGLPLSSAYCTAVLAGRMPALIPDSHADHATALLDVTFELQIGAYLGVPLTGPDGTVQGMLCAISSTSAPALSERDLVSARLIAELIEDLHRRALGSAEAQRRRDQVHEDVVTLCAGRGRTAVLQPVVDLSTGNAVAAEGLTRFTLGTRTPAEWFAVADTVGMRRDLEVVTAQAVLRTLATDHAPPAVAVNLSPDVIVDGCLDGLLGEGQASRVIVEVTEHAPVGCYEKLQSALRTHRAAGLRLAVDDAGAGYASMTHVLRLEPDFIKIDMSLIRGIDGDQVRRALVAAMAAFATDTATAVVAEGVETQGELATLAQMGIPYAQGFLFGQPTARPRWSGYDVAGAVGPLPVAAASRRG